MTLLIIFAILSFVGDVNSKEKLNLMEKYIRCLMTVALITSVLSGCLIFPGGGRSREKVVVLETNKGLIVVELYPQAAPKTVDNFKTLVRQGFYDGLSFHRYVEGFVIQGGCPRGDGTGDPGWSIEGEFQDPALQAKMPPHIQGVVSMARSNDPDSAGSQFYICLDTANHLDGNYTSFGRVISGTDVVMKLRKGDIMRSVRLEAKKNYVEDSS